jgi:DNA end-binding protein Ku
VALGRVVMSKRERVIALEALGKGLLGTTLHYPYEVRKAEEYFDEIPDLKVPAEMLKLAEHILETKAGDFDPSQFKDHYEEALTEFLRKKQAHIPIAKKEAAAEPRNVISLMDALRRSVQASGEGPAQPKKPRKRIEGQREMLLPIAGKQPQKEAREPQREPREAKKPARAPARQKKAG